MCIGWFDCPYNGYTMLRIIWIDQLYNNYRDCGLCSVVLKVEFLLDLRGNCSGHSSIFVYRIAGNFRWIKFVIRHALKAYFRGLIFVVCPEHIIIIVAYCLVD